MPIHAPKWSFLDLTPEWEQCHHHPPKGTSLYRNALYDVLIIIIIIIIELELDASVNPSHPTNDIGEES